MKPSGRPVPGRQPDSGEAKHGRGPAVPLRGLQRHPRIHQATGVEAGAGKTLDLVAEILHSTDRISEIQDEEENPGGSAPALLLSVNVPLCL